MKTLPLLIAGLLLAVSCQKKEAVPTPATPVADFLFPADAEAGESLLFQNTSQNATSYEWNFGDGSPLVADAQPHHTYATFGAYTITLSARNAVEVISVTKRMRVSKYDIFTHSGIPTTSTYATYGKRFDTSYNYNNGIPGGSTTSVTRLRDSLMTVVRLSPDSLRVNGILAHSTTYDGGFKRISATNPYVFQLSYGGDGTFLALYVPGDSLQLRQYSHLGHVYTRVDQYGGPRRP